MHGFGLSHLQLLKSLAENVRSNFVNLKGRGVKFAWQVLMQKALRFHL